MRDSDRLRIGVTQDASVRFYRWAISEAEQEARRGFPRVSRVRNVGTAVFLEMMRRRPLEDRVGQARLLVKRVFKDAAEGAGEGLSAADATLLQTLLDERGKLIAREGFRYLPDSGHRSTRDRDRLRANLLERLEPLYGPARPMAGRNVWTHETHVRGCTIVTSLDVGATTHQLAYEQAVRAGDHQLFEHASFLWWLGISGQTYWTIASEAEEEAAVDSLTALVAHFVDAAPLIAGSQ